MMQVDSALLGHPRVAEAVSFAAPDEKYGEVVAAAVVLTQPAGGDVDAVVADIRKFAATKLAKFKARAVLCLALERFSCVACCLTIANLVFANRYRVAMCGYLLLVLARQRLAAGCCYRQVSD